MDYQKKAIDSVTRPENPEPSLVDFVVAMRNAIRGIVEIQVFEDNKCDIVCENGITLEYDLLKQPNGQDEEFYKQFCQVVKI